VHQLVNKKNLIISRCTVRMRKLQNIFIVFFKAIHGGVGQQTKFRRNLLSRLNNFSCTGNTVTLLPILFR